MTTTLHFKTNINCGGCVSKFGPVLDTTESISTWTVDITSPDKILTVEWENITAEDVVALVQSRGFNAEILT